MAEKILADDNPKANANLFPGATYGLAEENGTAAGLHDVAGRPEPKAPAKRATPKKK